MIVFLIAVGGAMGSLARYALDGLIQNAAGPSFPWGTLAVNVTGSLLLGCILGVLEGPGGSPHWRAALGIGFCGAYTTFSTFSFETVRLLQNRQWLSAAGNLTGNVVLGLLALFSGLTLAARLLQTKG